MHTRRLLSIEAFALAVFVVLLLLPLGMAPYSMRLATVIFMWAALAGSWNLLAGYAGAVDLGPVVYHGLGAFATAAFMLKAGLPFLPSVVLAGVIAKAIMPGEERVGFFVTLLLGVAGALLGGFLATALGLGDPIDEFFDLSTWVAAVVGSLIILYGWSAIRERT